MFPCSYEVSIMHTKSHICCMHCDVLLHHVISLVLGLSCKSRTCPWETQPSTKSAVTMPIVHAVHPMHDCRPCNRPWTMHVLLQLQDSRSYFLSLKKLFIDIEMTVHGLPHAVALQMYIMLYIDRHMHMRFIMHMHALSTWLCMHASGGHFARGRDDTEVTLKRNPKTDGPRRATKKADMKCTERQKYAIDSHSTCTSEPITNIIIYAKPAKKPQQPKKSGASKTEALRCLLYNRKSRCRTCRFAQSVLKPFLGMLLFFSNFFFCTSLGPLSCRFSPYAHMFLPLWSTLLTLVVWFHPQWLSRLQINRSPERCCQRD